MHSRKITFLFQRLSVALQRGNAVSFLGPFPQDQSLPSFTPFVNFFFFVLVGAKITIVMDE